MKKYYRNKKLKKRRLARARYSAKRRTRKWKNRKKTRRFIAQINNRIARRAKKPPVILTAPKSFSLIANTDEVLGYFKIAENHLKKHRNIEFNISGVQILTPETVALMVASINDIDFHHKSNISGNAPKNPNLLKLFTESGFYDHVENRGSFISGSENLLHKEVNRKVVSEVAKTASLTGIKHVFGNEKPFEPLYEILVECMSNTNNHADLHMRGKCNWWLYVYSEPNEKITSYSFLDLGVGIFESSVVKNYLKNLIKGTILYPNVNLVDDLLSGKIQSRVDDVDQEIRGKGIPQIVEHSALPQFRSFYIITNDVKIDLKTMKRQQLKNKLNGTLLYWELQK